MPRPQHKFFRNTIRYAWIVTLFAPASASAEDALLGKIDFPNSGSQEAQADFIEGVLYMHNFEYREAHEAFVRAQAIDPGFALAYWGEAMTFHQSLWGRQSKKSAQDTLMRLGRTAEERAAKAPTQREKDYLRAAEILFGMRKESRQLPKYERDVLYRNAMGRILETYPDDLEARAFYGLSILGVGSAHRDYPTYIKAAAILTGVWDANRLHPGGAHYLIHSYDDPVHAILGLPMARAYSDIAPSAAHAQHMTSHIFSALGMWDDLVKANERSRRIEIDLPGGEGARSREARHYGYWLQYGYLQRGQYGKAEELLGAIREQLDHDPTGREKTYYGAMYSRIVLDAENWELSDEWLAPEGVEIGAVHYPFARAYAAIKRGDIEGARSLASEIRGGGEGNKEVVLGEEVASILRKQIAALIALEEGREEAAVALAGETVGEEMALPFQYGPPRVAKPTAEFLGDVNLELARYNEALAAYEDQLTRTPHRTNSLLGVIRAATAGGDEARAAHAYYLLTGNWEHADSEIPALAEFGASAE